jgi:hypothetical protein
MLIIGSSEGGFRSRDERKRAENMVGFGRVVRKVRQHPDDHEFESQQWQ